MGSCLIGDTGFVGGNLDRQIGFDHRFNSNNIGDIRGGVFDVVYCAGVSAVKWLANREPREDLRGIVRLLDAIRDIEAGRFVLISTVDIYKDPRGVDESTPISTQGLHPYGTHRRMVETFVAERFAKHHIVRLPGLFGDGLKKNIIYDLLNNNQLDMVHADASFQFYDLDGIGADIRKAIDAGIDVINFATEPVTVREVARQAFGIEFENRPKGDPPSYDMRTVHGKTYGSDGPYIMDKRTVLDEMKDFVLRQRG